MGDGDMTGIRLPDGASRALRRARWIALAAIGPSAVLPATATADPLRVVARAGQSVGDVRIGRIVDVQAADGGVVAFRATTRTGDNVVFRFTPGRGIRQVVDKAGPGSRGYDLADDGTIAHLDGTAGCSVRLLPPEPVLGDPVIQEAGDTCHSGPVGADRYPILNTSIRGDIALSAGRVFYEGFWQLIGGPNGPADTDMGPRVLTFQPGQPTPVVHADLEFDNRRRLRAAADGRLLVSTGFVIFGVTPGAVPAPIVGPTSPTPLPPIRRASSRSGATPR